MSRPRRSIKSLPGKELKFYMMTGMTSPPARNSPTRTSSAVLGGWWSAKRPATRLRSRDVLKRTHGSLKFRNWPNYFYKNEDDQVCHHYWSGLERYFSFLFLPSRHRHVRAGVRD